jgi:CRP-like cAMP-binding protein
MTAPGGETNMLQIDVGTGLKGSTSMDSRRNRLLASLPAPDLALIARHLKRVPLDHGAVLQEQDAPVELVYFPLSGAVSLLAVMQSGDAVETAIVGHEGAVGLFADLGPWQACTRAIVQTPGIAECIPASVLKTIAGQSPEISRSLLRYKEALSAQVQQTAACNALHSVEERMARWLLQALDRCDKDELPVTQDLLSQMLGVRRTTVTIVARKFQYDGLIRYRRGRIVVVNREALQRLSCECYGTCRRRLEAAFEAPDVERRELA